MQGSKPKKAHEVEQKKAYLSVADEDKKLILGSQATKSSMPAVPAKMFKKNIGWISCKQMK